MDVHGLFNNVGRGPRLTQEIGAADGAIRMACERHQEIEFSARQFYSGAVHSDRSRRRMNNDLSHLHYALVTLSENFCTSQVRRDSRHQFGNGERLGHIVVGAETKSGDTLTLFSTCRQQDDGDARGDAYTLHQLNAIKAGQHHIDDREVNVTRLEKGEPGGAGRGFKDLVTLGFEIRTHERAQRYLIVDKEYPRSVHVRSLTTRTRAVIASVHDVVSDVARGYCELSVNCSALYRLIIERRYN